MLLIMGPAGAGKSIQAQKLVDEKGYEWVSTGVVLREAMKDPNVQKRMEHGELLDDTIVEDIVATALKKSKNPDMIILDGFPRDHHQARWLIGFCRGSDLSIDGVIHIEVDFNVAHERLISRGRTDDHHDAIENRFKEYQEVTKPILEYYKKQSINIIDIEGDQSIREVHDEIARKLSDL